MNLRGRATPAKFPAQRFDLGAVERIFIRADVQAMHPAFLALRSRLAPSPPEVFVILGNDDARAEEAAVLDAATRGAWRPTAAAVRSFLRIRSICVRSGRSATSISRIVS